MPWGFNGFAPETDGVGMPASPDDTGGFWFYSNSRRFFGMRLTHQPSPWCAVTHHHPHSNASYW